MSFLNLLESVDLRGVFLSSSSFPSHSYPVVVSSPQVDLLGCFSSCRVLFPKVMPQRSSSRVYS